jgi:hypothetical protein
VFAVDISRLENLPDTRTLLRMGRAMVDLYCASFKQVPKRIVLERHIRWGSRRPTVAFVQRALRIRWRGPLHRRGAASPLLPTPPLARDPRQLAEDGNHADSHYCCPEVLDWCRSNGLDYIFGVAPTTTLRVHIETLEAKARFEAAPKDGKLCRFKEFFDGAASWSRVEQIIARAEVGDEGADTRFIVTNLNIRNPRVLYEDVYCRRGQAENHIKSWKTHLAADRTSCSKATANQLRLFLHGGAYWLMWGRRASMPKRSMWRVA